MTKKYYAIRKGRNTGIYSSWEEARKQVENFSGAEYKSFANYEDAKAYLEGKDECSCPDLDEDAMLAYVDGSYDEVCGSGVVICYENGKERYYFWSDDQNFSESSNITGEIMAALFAMNYALKEGAKRLILKFDLEGLEKWATEEYKTRTVITRIYKYYYELFRKKGLEIIFEKVSGHSGDFCNEEADKLAKKAAKMESNVDWKLPNLENAIKLLRGYSVNNNITVELTEERFNQLLIYLENEKYEFEQTIKPTERTIKIKSKYFKDHLTVTYFKHVNAPQAKGTLRIQGRAVDVFKHIQLFLAKTEDYENYRAFITERVYEISSQDYSRLEEKLDQIVKGAYKAVSKDLKNVLITAYLNIFEEPTMPFKDFSFYLIPAMRVLEAFIGKALHEILNKLPRKGNNKSIESIGSYFKRDNRSGEYKIKQDLIQRNCNTSDLIAVVEKCYDFYHKQRHAHVHASWMAGHTSTISTKAEVDSLIMRALELVGDVFEELSKTNK